MSIISSNKLGRIRREIVSSIAGNDFDYTRISIKRAIILLAIPMVLEMLMESVFALTDIFFVSKLGANAVAGVGITESMLTIIYAFGVGLSMATGAVISRRIGEKKPEKASVAAFQSILISLFISMFIAIPGILFAKDLLRIMGVSKSVIEETYMYTSIILGTNAIIILLFVINSVFRSSGDAAISMRVLWLGNIINILLDPCLIFGIWLFPELGVKGAAVATTIGRGTAVIYQLYILLKGNKRVSLALRHLKFRLDVMLKIVRLSLGTIGQYIIATSSWMIMIRILAVFGEEVLAGYTIAIRVIIFIILPSMGLSNAAATLVGQYLGAKMPEKAEKAVWLIGFVNMVFMSLVGVLVIIFSENIMLAFISDPIVVASGILCLKVIGIGFVSYSFGMVIVQSFNGAGDTTTPTIINLFCFWLLEIPLAYLLAIHYAYEQLGVYLAIVISETILVIVGAVIFKRGRWKNRKV